MDHLSPRSRRLAGAVTASVLFWGLARPCFAMDCEPKIDCTPKKACSLRTDDRVCDAASSPPCVQQTETRDCDPRWACESDCQWFDVGCTSRKAACESSKAQFRYACEAQKAIQNAVYAAKFSACQADRQRSADGEDGERKKAECETARAAQNAIFASEYEKCQNQLALEQLECEVGRLRLKEDCLKGRRGPFGCSAGETMAKLAVTKLTFVDKAQQRLTWLTTSDVAPTEGWVETACEARGKGVPYHDAVLTSDRFWTIDLKLESFAIGDLQKPSGTRYVRLIIRPAKWGGGVAHEIADRHYITTKDTIDFSGPVMIDRTAATILEVHVKDGLEIAPVK